jgi:hypothetical protein
MTIEEFAVELEKIYGDNLKSIVAYGASINDAKKENFRDLNIFCVLTDPSPVLLVKSNKLVRRWVKKGNNPPHFFGPRHIETSLDVFPMEFMEIKENHRLLAGTDPLKNLNVDIKNLRHECESELKGKLIHLRTFYAGHCNKPGMIASAMIDSLPAILAGFRAALRLIGEKPPPDPKSVIELLAIRTEVNAEVFFDLISAREGLGLKPRGDDALLMFERYLKEISLVAEFVDKMDGQDKR